MPQKSTSQKSDPTQKKASTRIFKAFRQWFNYNIGYKTSLANLKNESTHRSYIKASISLSPIQYLFFGATFNKDINRYKSDYYQPDFSYSFGYSDWHQGTWSFLYSNYANNKINPKKGENRFNFKAGTWETGYKDKYKGLYLSGTLQYIPIAKEGSLSFKASKVFDNKLLVSAKHKISLGRQQQQLTLTAKQYLYRQFFAMGSIYLYTSPDTQSDLEPDYAFKFGWKAKQKGDLSIIYSNYFSPTRWAWRKEEGVPFDAGSLSISMDF